MRSSTLAYCTLLAVIFMSSCEEAGVSSDFDKILGTYSGAATYYYQAVIDGQLVQDQQEAQLSITVSAVSKKDMTFRISGTGFLERALTGYDNTIYTWDNDNFNGGIYFAVNNLELPGSSRNISTRFTLSTGNVELDYDELVFDVASTEQIHFEGN